jgi:hypothetical protein
MQPPPSAGERLWKRSAVSACPELYVVGGGGVAPTELQPAMEDELAWRPRREEGSRAGEDGDDRETDWTRRTKW